MEDLNKLRDIDALKISLASSDEILSWSYGEVTKPETINYRTFKPEKDGLFCEKIFGPVKDYECYCGKYKRIRYKGVVCDRCGVQVTTSKVRRERMGHINLASPVTHVWFFKNIPSVLATLLGIAPRSLELVIYFSSFIVTDIDHKAKKQVLAHFEEKIKQARDEVHNNIELEIKSLIGKVESNVKALSDKPEKSWEDKLKSKAAELRRKAQEKAATMRSEEVIEQEKAEINVRMMEKKLNEVEMHTVMTDKEFIELEEHLDEFCEVSIGAEAVEKILAEVDLKKLSKEIRSEMKTARATKNEKLKKRLRVVESFLRGGTLPSSTIIRVLPVMPPDLRPMVQLEGGRFATSDLNDLYRRIINRNNRLKRLMDLGAPEIIVRNEKRMLQEAVDALIDSSKVRKTRSRDRKTYRSLADAIKGKQGHFRANLLGKRVDYSGRAVIVSGPHLKMNECGLPTEMALELYRPFLIKEIMDRGLAPNMKTAKYVLEEKADEVYDILEEIVGKRPVLLNRAPTLHRLSIQAFYPRLTDGKAIQLHPVVCSAFNADFDGDQMAIHLPLSEKAVKEAEEFMLSTSNLLKPADGSVISIPSHEIVLGLYYLTSVDESIKEYQNIFADFDEAQAAFGNKVIELRQQIKVRHESQIIETTVGKIILNQFIPEELGFINKAISKSEVKKLIGNSINLAGIPKTIELIDVLKTYGFKYSTLSGISLSIFDCVKPSDLETTVAEAKEEIAKIDQNYQMGLITKAELSKLSQRIWLATVDHFDTTILSGFAKENPVSLVISAGAGKASSIQMRQIAAIKGSIADPKGRIIDMPVLGNYSNGMSSFDYFLTGRGTRRSYMDKGLGTADAGYLTRRLVGIAQHVIVRTEDCLTNEGRVIKRGQNTPLHQWYERIVGRHALKTLKDGDKIIAKKNDLITSEMAKAINDSKLESVEIRSAVGCRARYGICAKCYGLDPSNNQIVKVGAAVGIVAAQSIGEPGTQLTMNVFHSGGIAGKNITQGLPRIEELFEVRRPKNQAVMSAIAGKIKLEEESGQTVIVIEPNDKDLASQKYKVDHADEVLVANGDLVAPGSVLTDGALNLQDTYDVVGANAAQEYILQEVQNVYGSQGVSLDDKHVEVVVKQMFNRVKIKKSGDTALLPGDIISIYKLEEENRNLPKGKEPAEGKFILLGISKASRMSESWLDAASFEETASVLTESSISGSIDDLLGPKENVIIGRQVPVGEDARIDELMDD